MPNLEKIKIFFKELDRRKVASALKKLQIHTFIKKYSTALWIILLSYMCSSVVSSSTSAVLLSIATPSLNNIVITNPEVVKTDNSFNYKEASSYILDRNLFNLSGALPDESSKDASGVFSTFDPSAPCSPCTLGLSVLGIISQGKHSVVSIKDNESEYTDFYTVGDALIDKDGASIYSISPDIVVINNKGSKECLVNVVKNIDKVLDEMGVSVVPKEYSGIKGGSGAQSACGLVTLSENFINAELGIGFSNILNKAKVIPNITESGMTGFKLLGIVPGSIFDRICLKDGDIVTQVNDTSLLDPDQGFALYEAFQKDREIHIQFIRNEAPMVVDVRQE